MKFRWLPNYFNTECNLFDRRVDHKKNSALLRKMKDFCENNMEERFTNWVEQNYLQNTWLEGLYPIGSSRTTLENILKNPILFHYGGFIQPLVFSYVKKCVHHVVQQTTSPVACRLIFNNRRQMREDFMSYLRSCLLFHVGLRYNMECSRGNNSPDDMLIHSLNSLIAYPEFPGVKSFPLTFDPTTKDSLKIMSKYYFYKSENLMCILSRTSPLFRTYLNLLRVELARFMLEKRLRDEYYARLKCYQNSAVSVYLAALSYVTIGEANKVGIYCRKMLQPITSRNVGWRMCSCTTGREHAIAGANLFFIFDISNTIGFLALFENVRVCSLKRQSTKTPGTHLSSTFLAEYFLALTFGFKRRVRYYRDNDAKLRENSVLENCLLQVTKFRLKREHRRHNLFISNGRLRKMQLPRYSLESIINKYALCNLGNHFRRVNAVNHVIRLCHALSCFKNKDYSRVLKLCRFINFDEISWPNRYSENDPYRVLVFSLPVLAPFQLLFDDDVVSLAGLLHLLNPFVSHSNRMLKASMIDLDRMNFFLISFQFLNSYLILISELNSYKTIFDRIIFDHLRELDRIAQQNKLPLETCLIVYIKRKICVKYINHSCTVVQQL